MLSQRLYYLFKPVLPWSLRMGVRRFFAQRKRDSCGPVWPIHEAAGEKPIGWPGWPDGKKFALVLTHDVEGPDGLAKCRRLAQLEMELGFRSSFNFIPEGSYRVQASQRDWLSQNGFEVGVHDLEHDGKLFQSRSSFKRKALRINRHIRDWGASGFRSGFMLRNLDWLHELEIAYDASTFDTDPFEPQSEGAGTIFPFWVPAPNPNVPRAKGGWTQAGASQGKPLGSGIPSSGYLELPYTLPQDSTLFLVLREPAPTIWTRKLDWVVSKGGMALVNVHPDYLRFEGEKPSAYTYPVSFYRELLNHIREHYAGQYWHPLPKELTRTFSTKLAPAEPEAKSKHEPETLASKGGESLRGKKAAVILYSYFPSDPRPRRAAEAMVAAGMEVDLLCLSENEAEPPRETVGGVKVTRLPVRHLRGSKWAYFWQYGRFFLFASWFLLRNSLSKKYDVVHVHNMPDFMVFAALVPKMRGARIILDLHDPMPELMESIYDLKAEDWKVWGLRRVERWSIAFSDLALTPNVTFKNLFVSRSCTPEKMQIVMNSPQQEIFDPSRYPSPERTRGRPDGFRVMHHGSIVRRHGVDLLVKAVGQLRTEIPSISLHIYGSSTPFLGEVLALAESLGIADIVHYHGSKTQVEIAQEILKCDVGVVPNRRSAFIEINFPTRLFEYIAMHRPVVAPSTKGIRDYFAPEQILFFEPDDVSDLAAQIRRVWAQPAEVRKIVLAGHEIYHRHMWTEQRDRFIHLVSTLCART